jgi:tetratricopeptide (TPR) repeat protein
MMQRVLGLMIVGLLTFLAPLVGEFGVTGFSAYAAEDEEPPRKTRRVPSMSEATFKKLAEAQELIDAKDMQGALNVLNEMLERSKRLNGNEIGQVHNMLGFVYFSMENYDKALEEYKIVVAQGEDIPEGLEVTTLYTLAQLSFVADNYQDALKYMEIWLTKANNPGADPHIFMGQVYYQMKDYPKAIQQIELGISIAKERNQPVKENWWALLNYLYYEQENWPKVIEILEIMVTDYPKREYWIRLAGVLGQEGDEKGQVYAMESAYNLGFLDRERDLMSFAGLLMQEQVPYRAAQVMQKGIDDGLIEKTSTNLQSFGQALQLSQEIQKAIPVLQDAAKLSDDGKIYDRLSQLYLEDDQFGNCVDAAQRAIDKGGLRRLQQTYVVKGMCQFNQENLSAARTSFVACRNEARRDDDDTNVKVCNQWITYIDREADRRKQLAAAG